MLKKVFFALSTIGLLFAGTAFSFAASSLPSIKVSEIVVNGESFKAGTKIEGTFFLANVSSFFADNLYYKISLVGSYQQNGLAKTFLGESVPSEFFKLEPRQAKSMRFSYTLPSSAEGTGLGIQIGVYNKQGMLLGWADSKRIAVVEGLPSLSLASSSIKISGGDTFSLGFAPTINAEDTKEATLEITFKNPSTGDITVTPVISITAESNRTVVIKEVTGIEKTLKPNEEVSWSIPLPHFEYKTGVYFGTLALLDQNGEKRSNTLELSYSVRGKETATIYNFSASKENVLKGEAFSVSLQYAVSPGPKNTTPVSIDIKVFNEKNSLIASYNAAEGEDATGALNQIMRATKDAKAMRGEVVVRRGDIVLAEESAFFSANYESASSQAKTFGQVVPVASLVVLFIILFGLYKHGKLSKRTFSILTIVLIVLVLLAALGVRKTQAFVQTGYDASDCTGSTYQTTQFVSSVVPHDNSSFQTGATFNVTGSIYYPYGAPWAIEVDASAPGTAEASGMTPNYTPSNTQPQFSVGPLVIDATHGNQVINLTITGHYNVYCKEVNPSDCSTWASNPAPDQFNFVRACEVYTVGYIPYTNNTGDFECEPGYVYVNDVCVPQTDGECGASNGGTFETVPTTDLCATGTATDPIFSAPQNYGDPNIFWYCYDPNFAGTTASCSATVNVVEDACIP
ncbi:MAG: hypothetical protein WC761_03110 [Candidatus Paceibacterota bacterium]|jgi:hypothetical protein